MSIISLEDFEAEMAACLTEVEEDVDAQLDQLKADASQDLLQRLRTGQKHGGRTPELTGEYAAGWTERQEWKRGGSVRVIYNAKKPQLTHLLEYGHKNDDGKTVGRRQHIRLAIEETKSEIDKALK